jgi:polar amino acid transport system permease protein
MSTPRIVAGATDVLGRSPTFVDEVAPPLSEPPPSRRFVVERPRRLTPSLVATSVVLLFLVAVFVNALVTAPTMQWGVVAHYLFSGLILTGVLHTIELTVICELLAVLSAAALAWMLLYGNIAWRSLAHSYQWFFRSVPELAQLIFWFNLSLLFPQLKIGIPFGGPSFESIPMNTIMIPWVAAIVGIGLHEGAYLAEVFRSGINSVDAGQREATQALGLTPRRTFSKVILPQAMWVIVPNAGSRLIGTLKMTSLASILGISELLYTVESIYGRTYQTIPLLVVAAIWYMVCVAVLRVVQHFLERHYSAVAQRGARQVSPVMDLAVVTEDTP